MSYGVLSAGVCIHRMKLLELISAFCSTHYRFIVEALLDSQLISTAIVCISLFSLSLCTPLHFISAFTAPFLVFIFLFIIYFIIVFNYFVIIFYYNYYFIMFLILPN